MVTYDVGDILPLLDDDVERGDDAGDAVKLTPIKHAILALVVPQRRRLL